LFLQLLEQTRQRYGFVVIGYGVMPEHFHVLIGEPEKGTPSTVLQVVKQRFAKRVLRAQRKRECRAQPTLWREPENLPAQVWQARFYDFNVWSRGKRVEKLRYMHPNPVKRGLVLEAGQWAWSSFRDYAHDEPGRVKLNQWPAAQLRRTACATKSPPLQRTQGRGTHSKF
jgi:putative transposase